LNIKPDEHLICKRQHLAFRGCRDVNKQNQAYTATWSPAKPACCTLFGHSATARREMNVSHRTGTLLHRCGRAAVRTAASIRAP
jgi:hypothetical protein